MMVRMQISLPAEEHRRIKERAAQARISVAEYVRRLVSRDLGHPGERGSIEAVFDLGHGGESAIADHKDDYVGEAFDALRR